jgi:hypothetical protein
MTVALIVTCALLGLIATGSAAGKFTRNPKILESAHGVGVTDSQLKILAILELLGAAGLVVGIFIPGLGLAAAFGLTLYFLGAVVSHLRKHQNIAEWTPALVLAALALAGTLLQLQR